MFRIVLKSLVVAMAFAGVSNADEKKKDEVPAPRPVPMPPVVAAPGTTAAPSAASPGTLWSPYEYRKYPVPGQIVVVPGNAYAYLPARAVYGPAASPNEYPYYAFVPAPYPGPTYINPYPRTVSSYSYGPTAFPTYRGR